MNFGMTFDFFFVLSIPTVMEWSIRSRVLYTITLKTNKIDMYARVHHTENLSFLVQYQIVFCLFPSLV